MPRRLHPLQALSQAFGKEGGLFWLIELLPCLWEWRGRAGRSTLYISVSRPPLYFLLYSFLIQSSFTCIPCSTDRYPQGPCSSWRGGTLQAGPFQIPPRAPPGTPRAMLAGPVLVPDQEPAYITSGSVPACSWW